MKEIKQLLRELSETGEGTLKVKIEDRIYERKFYRPERLIILGGGHVGQAISKFASAVGFYIVVVDDRPAFANHTCFPDAKEIYCEEFEKALDQIRIGGNDYVTVVTRGHRFDLTCLRKVLSSNMPRYLGMMGSKRRVAGIIDLLQEEGNPPDTVAQIHMPIGLNIGALTVPEIAISIVAELIEERRKETPRHSHSQQLTCNDTNQQVLEMLADTSVGKAMLLVYDTSGSTPVKSGAFMTVDSNFQTAGTIGGGCTENEVVREAFHMIGTGTSKSFTLDMSNEVAADQGMVCGGQMKVYVVDVDSSRL